MLRLLGKNWWIFVVQGLAAALFGLLALIWPGRTLQVLIALFGAYALVDGVLSLFRTFRASALGLPWWPFLLQGLAGVAAGLLTFTYPGLTALVLLFFIAGSAILFGALQLFIGIRFREELRGEWLLMVSGGLAVLFGLWLILAPGEGALAVVGLIGFYALIQGAVLIGLGFKLRSLHERLQEPPRRQPA
jgi:uncharacterized membrane protein HdeD (DUF308 family)